MTQVEPDRTHGPDALSEPFTPGVPTNPPELLGFPETLAGPLPPPPADPLTQEFVEVRPAVDFETLQFVLVLQARTEA